MTPLHMLMADDTVEIFNSSGDSRLDQALRSGARPVRVNASGQITYQYSLNRLGGGYLLDGCPLNVVIENRWLPGQIDALKAAGITPNCPECRPGSQCWTEWQGASADPSRVTGSGATCGPGFLVSDDSTGCVPDESLSPDEVLAINAARVGLTVEELEGRAAPLTTSARTAANTAANVGPSQTPAAGFGPAGGAPISVTAYGGAGGAGAEGPIAADAGVGPDSGQWLAENWMFVVAGLGLLATTLKKR